ncbi:5-formyltetrahydrofolate cyclo-ligase [Hoyosella sp. YIM 151337]|uniref:5-formyltetrahydrofolate cyclo-ligase n=1 Tax=Hoyosella sp. YIM 151337 TaxID=2992742 RepID=UPI002235B424|nr:5-formyltetrahydrofolate cyclo-ligase [Hoyosella sp. YIM 151337]MCW4352065.1 5-formyltetrahydrofolate cyclo-ligase [Hoyosella sp. YIM 151337]
MSDKGEQFGASPAPVQIPHFAGDQTRLDSKDKWRAAILAERAALSGQTAAAEANLLTEQVLTALALTAASASFAPASAVVAAYVPARDEPGSIGMLDALAAAGAQVLLPITAPGNTLDWGQYHPEYPLTTARYGLLEPTGPRLGAAALGTADVIFVPALAVDRRGVRLGRGAGYYDRALAATLVTGSVLAIVRDAEFVAELPESAHDRRVDGVVTPVSGLMTISSDSSGE